MRLDELHKFEPLKIKEDHQRETFLMLGNDQPPAILEGMDEDYIGLEVEVEGIYNDPHPKWLKCWSADSDPSLRDNGREYKSLPLMPKYTMAALAALKKGLDEASPDHYFRWRAAFHYHVNVRDLTTEQLAVYLLLYSTIEMLLFAMTKSERLTSNFCVPVNDTKDFYGLVSELLDGVWDKDIVELREAAGGKYAALGLFRIHDLGTVEFRHMHGNLNLPLLSNWIGIGLSLKERARYIKPKQLEKILSPLNTTSRYDKYVQALGLHLDGNIPVALFSEAISNAKQVFARKVVARSIHNSPLATKLMKGLA